MYKHNVWIEDHPVCCVDCDLNIDSMKKRFIIHAIKKNPTLEQAAKEIGYSLRNLNFMLNKFGINQQGERGYRSYRK